MIVEGNSFLDYVKPIIAIMCARAGENKSKTSARGTLEKADAVYLSTIDDSDRERRFDGFEQWRNGLSIGLNTDGLSIYTPDELPELMESIRECTKPKPSRTETRNEPSEMATDSSPGRKPGDREPLFS